jgi:zinc and cadmium transporter
MGVWVHTLGSVTLVSLVSLVGVVALSRGRELLQRLLLPLVGLAAGALLGAALLHLIPEALHGSGSEATMMLVVCAGFVGFFALDAVILALQRRHALMEGVESYVPMNLIGDGVHNALDGMLIAAGFLAGTSVGIAVTIAILLHEVPHELGDFAVLVHGGLSVGRALLFNFLFALTAVAGALLVLFLGTRVEGVTVWVLPAAAGAFIYLAAAKLVPELLAEEGPGSRTALHALMIVVGVGLMVAATMLGAGHEHGH